MVIYKISSPVECKTKYYKSDFEYVITTIESVMKEVVSWEVSFNFPFIHRTKKNVRCYKINQIIPYFDESDYDTLSKYSNKMLKHVAIRDRKLADLWLKENQEKDYYGE